MRIASVNSYRMTNAYKTQNSKFTGFYNSSCNNTEKQTVPSPSFKGNFFKIAGGIAGLAAVTLLAPGAVLIGLGGLGVIPGALVGTAIDDKLEEKGKGDGPGNGAA